MKISGSQTVQARQQALWERLLDPQSIQQCLPGVQDMRETGPYQYSMTITVGVGPVKGTYSGTIHMSEINAPSSYRMQVEGKAPSGFVRGNGTVNLSPDGVGENETKIDYAGDVEIGGAMGAVAQRMLGGVANRMVGEFFSCIQESIGE